MVIFVALVGCHDILILGKNLIKWGQRTDMTIAADWNFKHQFKHTNKIWCRNQRFLCHFLILTLAGYRKVQVGKDQEKAQSERDSHSKNRGGKKPN